MKKHILYFLSLLLLLLTGCTPKRILTDLSEEKFVEYVALQDGYLHFSDADDIGGPHIGLVSLDMIAKDPPDYQDVVADLGMDPVEMSKTLPEKYLLAPETLQKVMIDGKTKVYPAGGYTFLLEGDPGEHYIAESLRARPEFRITLKQMTGTEPNSKFFYYPRHDRWLAFRVFPWELIGRANKDNIYRSEVDGREVGVYHEVKQLQAFFPGVEWDYFYGGFYVGDLAVCIESDYSYCTQEEFVEVFLAIFDYLTALEE